MDILLKTLESRLHNFKQVLPKLDQREGLIDFGGAVLKTLFRSAIFCDVHEMHEVFNELQGSQTDAIHSISKHVAYKKQLDALTGVNSGTIANLSSIVKDVVIHSHDKFKDVTRIILWLSVTIHNQSDLYMVIRQLEFDLLHLTQQLSEVMDAISYILRGKLPVDVLNPTTMHNILRNVTFHLPESYELLAGTRAENAHLYYVLVTVAVIGDGHCVQLVLNVPLKTASRYFVLHKIISLPARISDPY